MPMGDTIFIDCQSIHPIRLHLDLIKADAMKSQNAPSSSVQAHTLSEGTSRLAVMYRFSESEFTLFSKPGRCIAGKNMNVRT